MLGYLVLVLEKYGYGCVLCHVGYNNSYREHGFLYAKFGAVCGLGMGLDDVTWGYTGSMFREHVFFRPRSYEIEDLRRHVTASSTSEI